MHRDTVIEIFKKRIRVQFDTKKAAAKHIGISEQHMHRVLEEGHPIPDKVLDYLGLEKVTVTTYHKKKDKPK